MKFSISLLIMFISGNLFAQNINVTINERVNRFISRVQNYGDSIHRSGLMETKEGLFNNLPSDQEFSNMTNERDRSERPFLKPRGAAGATDEYRVLYAESRPLMERFIGNRFHDKKYTLTYDDYFHEYKIAFKNETASAGQALSIEDLRKESDKYVRTVLPFLKDKIEFDNNRIDYQNEKIQSALFLYRRIFKGGIVKLEVSKVEIVLNAQGTLQAITIKWPFFKKAEDVPSSETVGTYEGNNAAVREVLNRHSIATKWGTQDTLHATGAEIIGMAFGWFPAEMKDGTILLTPSYSYSAKVKYRDNVELNPLIDVPMLKKYW